MLAVLFEHLMLFINPIFNPLFSSRRRVARGRPPAGDQRGLPDPGAAVLAPGGGRRPRQPAGLAAAVLQVLGAAAAVRLTDIKLIYCRLFQRN